MLKCSPADESTAHTHSLNNSLVSDSDEGICKDLSFDRSIGNKLRQGVAETTSSTGTVSDARHSTEPSAPSVNRRRSQKFSDATTWSRFRQQKATALKSCSEKVTD